MTVFNNIILIAIGIALTLASLWYGQNNGLLPPAASDEAALYDGLFSTTMVIATGIFLVVQGLLIYSAFRFRRRAGDTTDGEHIDGNIPLEIVWTAIPALIVLWLAIDSFDVYERMQTGEGILMLSHSHQQHQAQMVTADLGSPDSDFTHFQPVLDSKAESLLTVEVSAMQYAWIFTYPDSGVVSSELHVPLNQRVKLKMAAQDVNHAFWVPQIRLKQDLIPGRTTDLQFTASKVGEYPIVCAELCGPYHGIMQSQLIVEEPTEFLAWEQSQVVATRPDPHTALSLHSESSFATAQLGKLAVDSHKLHQLHAAHLTH